VSLFLSTWEAHVPGKLDFKQIAESVDIEAVAAHLGITFKANRAQCPVCQSDDQRSLQCYPETNSYSCWAAKVSGDVISLWAHVNGYQGMYRAAKQLSEQFCNPSLAGHVEQVPEVSRGTAPQKPEARTESVPRRTQPAPAFDATAFAAKLIYSEEVKALGFSEEDAERFGVGFYRGRTYFPVRDASGFVAGFVGYTKGELKVPPSWLVPPHTNVVPYKRPA
jgi:hypothetical protein